MKAIKTYYGDSKFTWAACNCTIWRTVYPYENTGVHKKSNGGCGGELNHFPAHDELDHDQMVEMMSPLNLRVVGGERNNNEDII